MSDELKPCPFCGGKPTFVHATSEDIGNGYVCRTLAVISCDHCMFDMAGETDEDAVVTWNARSAVTDEQFAVAVHDGRPWQVVRECRNENAREPMAGAFEVGGVFRCSECGESYRYTELPYPFCPNCGAKVVG